MTEFTILLENGSLYKNVLVKIGRFFAHTNAEIYWYLKEHNNIEIYQINNTDFYDIKLTTQFIIDNFTPITIYKDTIYYFTTSLNYNH